MSPDPSPALAKKIAEARDRLDAHVREMVRWHFSPETGSPFWLRFARELSFDPRDAIGGYADLKKLGHFQDEWLRGGPVRRWLPKGLEGRPMYAFETGGSTGLPKTRLNISDFQTDYEMFGDALPDEGFPKGSDWLMLGPPVPGGCGSRSSTWPSTGEGSPFTSTWTPAGSTCSSRTSGSGSWKPTRAT